MEIMRVNTVDVTDIRSVGVENRQRTRIYSSDRWIKCEACYRTHAGSIE
jgi:hypothetical protein